MESKNIALRSKSMRNGDRPYTTPGLGDRAHSVLMAYQYSRAHKVPVTLHLTSDKYGKPLKICLLTSSDHKAHWWKGCTEIVMVVLDHSPDFPHPLTLRLLWSARWP